MSTEEADTGLEPAEEATDVPDWDDEYLDRVSDRLMFNFDLEKDYQVRGTEFTMYGELHVHHQKHFFHPLLSFAHHDTFEHLFVRRLDRPGIADLEDLVDLGHDLADEWIEADEEHYSTDFTFVVVAEGLSADVRSFVDEFRDRTMLARGLHGHYENHLVVVVPDTEEIVASREAHVEEAFRLWEPLEEEDPSWWDLLTRRLQI